MSCLALVVLLVSCAERPPRKLGTRAEECASEERDDGEFVELTAWHEGDFGHDRFPGRLALTHHGAYGVLTVYGRDVWCRLVELDREQVAHLQAVLRECDFLTLPRWIGKPVPSGGERCVRVVYADGRACESALAFLPGVEPTERPDARRFIECWLAIRGLFDEPAAFDGRDYIEGFVP